MATIQMGRAAARIITKRRALWRGKVTGEDGSLGFQIRAEASLEVLTTEVLKTSEIEGELLDAAQVRSSLAKRLGIDIGAPTPSDRDVEGVVEMILDAT